MDDPAAYDEIVAANITAARARRRLSQRAVAARMEALGFGWRQQIVAAAEGGRRRITVDEMLGLALALETSLVTLLEPVRDDVLITLPSGEPLKVDVVHELIWGGSGPAVSWDADAPRFPGQGHPGAEREHVPPPPRIRRGEPIEQPAPDRRGDQAQQPVVAAIVTSDLGVLVGRRNDRTPPWTFIAGEQEPGEQPEDTAIREVKEETTLRIQAGEIIGERVHPKTGRTMIYMAATPTHGTDVFVGDEAELAEVRWVSLAEADELLPGMYEPVREHLAATIGAGSGS